MPVFNVKRITTIIILLSLGLLVAGCIVGPNYRPPKVSMPGQWTGLSAEAAGNTSITNSEAAEISEWWKNFNDPQLNWLISQALQSNLTLKQVRARIIQAREARVIAGSSLWPNVDSSGSINSSKSGISGGGASNLFQAGLDSSWELDFFGGIRRSVEAAEANTQAAIEDSRDTMVTLTSEVALNYTLLRGYQQQLAIAQKNLDLQKQTAVITQKRFDVGFASGLDVSNASAQVATTQSFIPQLEAAAQQTIYNISVLLGREPAALLAELTPTEHIPSSPPVVPLGLPSDLLQRRPDIRRAAAQLHAATAQIGVATADLFPKFSLTGSAGGESLVSGPLGALAGSFWSIGTGVTFPLFNAGRIRANIKLLTAAQQEALLGYQQTVLTALKDVETALIAYIKDQQNRAALAEAVKANQRAVDLSTQAYTAGQVDFLNVLTAQHNLYSTDDSLVQADRTIATDLIALYKALGGGWEKGKNY
jgi:multidrug efflux system outer membrane protein